MNLAVIMNVLLFIIDPQVDFCSPTGALYVQGAEKRMDDIALYIQQHGQELTDICVSMDSHHTYHVGHAEYWVDAHGNHPKPFTQFDNTDIWKPAKAPLETAKQYLAALKAQGRTNTIWPNHCIIGTPGWEVFPSLQQALDKWNDTPAGKKATGWKKYKKGSFADAEMFSVLSTFDGKLVPKSNLPVDLESYDKIILCGVAEDICVAETVRDLLRIPSLKGKLIFFKKGMAPLDPNSSNMKVYDKAKQTFEAEDM